MEHTGPVDDDSAANLPPVSSQSYSDELDGVQVSQHGREDPVVGVLPLGHGPRRHY